MELDERRDSRSAPAVRATRAPLAGAWAGSGGCSASSSTTRPAGPPLQCISARIWSVPLEAVDVDLADCVFFGFFAGRRRRARWWESSRDSWGLHQPHSQPALDLRALSAVVLGTSIGGWVASLPANRADATETEITGLADGFPQLRLASTCLFGYLDLVLYLYVVLRFQRKISGLSPAVSAENQRSESCGFSGENGLDEQGGCGREVFSRRPAGRVRFAGGWDVARGSRAGSGSRAAAKRP